ncbi:unnamed protein product [Protopolystoma xenopodis]|uniref:EGF-like domain-containing protein n=1 Tax=Protopolystoma xenopodis TaxID=117903 RepID=A0A3S5FFK6_9PLAT|nr:unnamed protein product [Protopolystoma xenopodis]
MYYVHGPTLEMMMHTMDSVLVTCISPDCSRNGVCKLGVCRCFTGWRGNACDLPVTGALEQNKRSPNDGQHSLNLSSTKDVTEAETDKEDTDSILISESVIQQAKAAALMSNDFADASSDQKPSENHLEPLQFSPTEFKTTYLSDTSELKACRQLNCIHGQCQRSLQNPEQPLQIGKSVQCNCLAGWTGKQCDMRTCDLRCYQHGSCQDGVCICKTGWISFWILLIHPNLLAGD